MYCYLPKLACFKQLFARHFSSFNLLFLYIVLRIHFDPRATAIRPSLAPAALFPPLALAILCSLFGACNLPNQSQESDEQSQESICQGCTYLISAYDESIYSLTADEVICITASGHFTGRLNRATSTGNIRICNEGLFQPTRISLNSGTLQVDNYGLFRPGAINLNPGVDSIIINNFQGAEFRPGAFNLHEPGSVFHNYGRFSPARFSIAQGALFINHPSGITTTDVFSLRNSARAINQGSWTLKGSIDRDGSSSFQNEGSLELLGNQR